MPVTKGAPSMRAKSRPNRITDDPLLTVPEVLEELRTSKSTFFSWRAKGIGPRCIKLPGGDLRVRRSDLDRFIDDCERSA